MTRGLVIDPADAVVLDFVEGVLADSTAPGHLDIDVLPLVRQARAGELDVEPEPAFGVVRQGANFYLASAVRMTTYTTLNGAEVDQSTDHVMVFLQALDPDLLAAISSGYLLPGLRIAGDPGGTWTAALPIEAIGATEPVYEPMYFVWEPVLPGNEMLPRLLLGLFGIFTLMLLSVWAFVRRADAAGREMEAARRQAEVANQAKTDFLRVVTHEVRTPVNAIVGFAGIMKREMFGPIQNEKYAEYVEDISNAGDHVLTLVSDLLDLEKIEQGRMTFDIEAVEASTLARDASALVMELASGKGIKVDVEIDENLPPLETDARAVRQILINLLGNAIKFTPSGGHVWCRAFAPKLGGVALQVADTGPGIPRDQIERVLAPFGQMVTDYSEGQRGSGLGLPIAKRMTEALGGTFAFESEVGRGTTATIRFGG